MLSQRNLWARAAGLVLAAALAAAPARAADIDRYLPDDTEILLNVNVRQVLDSPLVKKYALEHLKEALKSLDQAEEVLKDLGFDPFTDLDRVLAASPGGGETDRGLLIVHGRFDLAKFKARGEEAAQNNGDILKIHKIADGSGGQFLVYEVTVQHGDEEFPLFIALPEKTTFLASRGKDYVVDALRKSKRKAPAKLKSKQFQALLERMDPKQSVSLAALGSALLKGEGAGKLPGEVKKQLQDLVDKIDAVGGGVTIDEGIAVQLVISAKDADDAASLKEVINQHLQKALVLVAGLANLNNQFNPLLEVVKSFKVGVKGKVLTLKGEVSEEVLKEAAGKGK